MPRESARPTKWLSERGGCLPPGPASSGSMFTSHAAQRQWGAGPHEGWSTSLRRRTVPPQQMPHHPSMPAEKYSAPSSDGHAGHLPKEQRSRVVVDQHPDREGDLNSVWADKAVGVHP